MGIDKEPSKAERDAWRQALADYANATAVVQAACEVRSAAERVYFGLRDRISDAPKRLGMDALEATVARCQGEADAIINRLVATPAPTPDAIAEKIRVLAEEEVLLDEPMLAAVMNDLRRMHGQGWRELRPAA